MSPNLSAELMTRAQWVARKQQLFGILPQFQVRTRPTADERVDLPEIQESTRVSFSDGAKTHASQMRLSANATAIAMYEQMAALGQGTPAAPRG